MKGLSSWSFSPYSPFFFETGDIYVCRLVPDKTTCHCEWLGCADQTYEIWLRREGQGAFELASRLQGTAVTLINLAEQTDYEFYVSCGEKRSRVRLFRTGEVVGTVVNYLHPRDNAYAFSGQYLCSPSIIRHPEGYLLTSMDLFGYNTPQNLTLIFRSDDDGETWHYVSELYPCFWGKMFVHRNDIYMLGCSTEYGDFLIGKSTDGGKSFGVPTVLMRGSGRTYVAGVHRNPQPVIEYQGRLYNTLEWGSWGEGYHAPMVMSADVNDDLLDPASWHFAPPVKYDPTWPGVGNGPSSGNIEGALAVAPDGTLYNIMRYDMTRCTPNFGKVLAYRVNTKDPDAPLEYDHAIDLPGNHTKFNIHQDEKTGLYFTIISRILDEKNVRSRNLLSLMYSKDLDHWELATDLIDRREDDAQLVGFQYVDFLIEENDLLFLCRTAMNGAHNYHDANYQTFHRVRNFRALVKG